MDRREFLRDLGVTSAVLGYVATNTAAASPAAAAQSDPSLEWGVSAGAAPDVAGHTFVCEFKVGATGWQVCEELPGRVRRACWGRALRRRLRRLIHRI